jgi:glyoxylase-like metal-dependent hydrolase (beta-lactamase superfamily II)
MEISPNVFWLGGRRSNFYLCQDDDGLTLVDCGMPGRQELVVDAIRELGRGPSDLVRIVITHADIDHAGSAAAIQAQTGAAVIAGSETAGYLRAGKSPRHLPRPIQLLSDRFFRYDRVPEASIQICNDGDVLPVLGGLHVLATPGHTTDHCSFYSPTAGVLFAGDALRTEGDKLRASPKLITADEDAARNSAIRLLTLAPAVFACGHGTPMSHHDSDDLMSLLNELRRS